MSKSDFESLGDRTKAYEGHECDRHFLPLLPIYARLDGRSFHSFTKGMVRPFDADMHTVMRETMRFLVEETHANVGYTQSDEISLGWYNPEIDSEMFFNRRIFKLSSVLAGMASAKFNHQALLFWKEKTLKQVPVFDCRVYQVPNPAELANCFLWRELDATKNAITMAAQALYSHHELHGKNGAVKQEMMFKKGVNFNDYPAWIKRGTYAQRIVKQIPIPEETRLKIPESRRPAPGHLVTRSSVEFLDLPPLLKIANREAVLFEGVTPELLSEKKETAN